MGVSFPRASLACEMHVGEASRMQRYVLRHHGNQRLLVAFPSLLGGRPGGCCFSGGAGACGDDGSLSGWLLGSPLQWQRCPLALGPGGGRVEESCAVGPWPLAGGVQAAAEVPEARHAPGTGHPHSLGMGPRLALPSGLPGLSSWVAGSGNKALAVAGLGGPGLPCASLCKWEEPVGLTRRRFPEAASPGSSSCLRLAGVSPLC